MIIKVWGTSSLGFTDENIDRKRMLRMKNQSIAKPKRSKIEYLVNWVMTLNNVSFHRKQCLLNYIEISALYKRDFIVYQGDTVPVSYHGLRIEITCNMHQIDF